MTAAPPGPRTPLGSLTNRGDGEERAGPGTRSCTGDAGRVEGGSGGQVLGERMPDYEHMSVQELAGMMSVYGLKKKSKR